MSETSKTCSSLVTPNESCPGYANCPRKECIESVGCILESRIASEIAEKKPYLCKTLAECRGKPAYEAEKAALESAQSAEQATCSCPETTGGLTGTPGPICGNYNLPGCRKRIEQEAYIRARIPSSAAARTTYEPLPEEHIEEIRRRILAWIPGRVAKLDPKEYTLDPSLASKQLNTLCDMAINSLLYGQEIDRLRSLLSETESTKTATQERPLNTNGGHDTAHIGASQNVSLARGEAPRVPASSVQSAARANDWTLEKAARAVLQDYDQSGDVGDDAIQDLRTALGTPSSDGVTVAKSFARRVERHLATYGQAELDRRALADMIEASTQSASESPNWACRCGHTNGPNLERCAACGRPVGATT